MVDKPRCIYIFAFLITHEKISKEVKHCLIEDLSVELLNIKSLESEKVVQRLTAKQETIAEKDKALLEQAQIELSVLKKEIKALKKQLDQQEIQGKKDQEIVQQLQKGIEKGKTDCKTKLEGIKKDYDTKLAMLSVENKKLDEELNKLRFCLQYTFPQSSIETYDFIIVHKYAEMMLVENIYPEIKFININQWNDNKNNISQDIDTIYIAWIPVKLYL